MPDPTKQQPLAKATPAWKLPGLMRKILDVPAQSQGIVVLRSGRHRLLPAGRHIVSVLLPRIIWNDTGDWAGFVPLEPFPAFYNIPNLLTGDGELVDASLLCLVKVANPLQFFQNQVMPVGEIPAVGLELSPHLVKANLIPLTRRYVADDLSAGLPTDFLLSEIAELVRHQVESMGLALVSVKVFSFIPALERVELADKLAELDGMLADGGLQARLGGAQSQAELDDLMRDLHKDSGVPSGVRPVFENTSKNEPRLVAPASDGPKKAASGPVANIKNWLGIGPGETQPGRATGITDLLNRDKPQPEVGSAPALDRLVNGSPTDIDRLVRSQVDLEFAHINEMLQDCRSRAYRAGDETTGVEILRLMRDLEKRRAKFQDPGFGAAAYRSGLNMASGTLGKYMAYDEGLLVQLANHSEFAHILQQKVVAGQPVMDELKVLASRLETFEHAFSRRARVVQPR